MSQTGIRAKRTGIDITENLSYNDSIAKLNPFRYRGYYYDTETGLYYLNTRYYDPKVGRFISRDSIDYATPETIDGLNLYAYCGDNPVMYVDPSGHIVISTIVGAIIGIVVSSAISGFFAGANAAEGESFGSAFLGGFVNGILSGIGLALGLAVAAVGGIPALIAGGLIAVGLGLVGGIIGSVTTQAISYGEVNWNVSLLAGVISAGINLMAFISLNVSGIFSTTSKFLSRFSENLKMDIIPFGISVYLGTLPMFNPNDLRSAI